MFLWNEYDGHRILGAFVIKVLFDKKSKWAQLFRIYERKWLELRPFKKKSAAFIWFSTVYKKTFAFVCQSDETAL